jgi:hypothetical protein
MKKLILHIAIFVLGVAFANSQTLNSSGKIENMGTIKIKSGQVTKLAQDTIDGRFEMLQQPLNTFFSVPNIVYGQLVIKNKGKKIILDEKDQFGRIKKLIVRDSLIMADSARFGVNYIGLNPEVVIAQSSVTNNESAYQGKRDLVMQNYVMQQDLLANGKFSRLNIDNPFGVNVKTGGFEITEKLTLTKGELQNSTANNFTMKDSTEIERFVGASLAETPKFENNVNITYSGVGSLVTSGEVPPNPTTLRNLKVNNTDSLILSKNITVNDTLQIRAKLLALADTLTYTNSRNPIYLDSSYSEVSGYFRRTSIPTGQNVVFHNPYTFVNFADAQAKGSIQEILLDIRYRTFPKYDVSNSKVQRSFDFYAFDINGDEIFGGFTADFGFGWRVDTNYWNDETNQLISSFNELILQKWNGLDYDDLESTLPALDDPNNWGHSNYFTLNSTGSYAIGLSSLLSIFVQSKVLLEGSYIPNSQGRMRMDMWNGRQGNLLLTGLNQNQFPINLVKNIDITQIKSVPDSVVDWVVVEFRNSTDPNLKFSKLLLVRYDGRIVDIYGNPNVRISKNEFDPKIHDSSFDVVIFHRNHASVKSLAPIELIAENNTREYNFSSTDFVMGAPASLKLVDISTDKNIYALRAGYYVNDTQSLSNMLNVLNPFTQRDDHLVVWNNVSTFGYMMFDYDMDGIITTRDFNMSWNNREE